MASGRTLRVETPEESRHMLLGVLDDQPGPARDIVILNAGVALYVANVVASMGAGVERARAALSSGAARKKLDQFVFATTALKG
jgi:anthranilate phosphoribosyltransferase